MAAASCAKSNGICASRLPPAASPVGGRRKHAPPRFSSAARVPAKAVIVEREPDYRSQETVGGFAAGLFGVSAEAMQRLGDDRNSSSNLARATVRVGLSDAPDRLRAR